MTKLNNKIEQIREDAKTMTSRQLSQKYGVSRYMMSKTLRENNIKAVMGEFKTTKGYKHIKKDEFVRLAEKGKTVSQIAIALDKTENTVSSYAKRHGITLKTRNQKIKERNHAKIMRNYDIRDMAQNIARQSGVHYSTLNNHLKMDGMTHSQRRHHVIVDMYKSGKTQKQVGEELRASTWWHTRGTDAKFHSFTNRLVQENQVLLEKSVDKRTYKGSISKLNKLVARHNHYASQINKEQLQLDLIDSWDIKANTDYSAVNADGTPKYTWKEIAERNGFSTGFIQDHVKTKTRKTVSA